MQTPAERRLIEALIETVGAKSQAGAENIAILNIGAGASPLIERELESGLPATSFSVDRLDIKNHAIDAPHVRGHIIGSVEQMDMIADGSYDIAFANYVFEHVGQLDKALAEVCRVLKPAGVFILSVPNPKAPEFIISKHTPHGFHKTVRGAEETAFETAYAYRSLSDLVSRSARAGLRLSRLDRFSALRAYAERFPLIVPLVRMYDAIVNSLSLTPLMGQACLVLIKD